jgi:hypothetical protein
MFYASGKYDVSVGDYGCVRWNVHLAERFLCGNKIFIHPNTNFYATSMQKTFLRVLTIVSMHPIVHYTP